MCPAVASNAKTGHFDEFFCCFEQHILITSNIITLGYLNVHSESVVVPCGMYSVMETIHFQDENVIRV